MEEPSPRRPRVLLAASGSVATVKLGELCRLLCDHADVRVVVTAAAKNFVTDEELPAPARPILVDADEWRERWQPGAEVLHIELRRWADVLVIAPLSANTLAKAANGLCDNLLTCVVRAWDFSKPLLVAPAMNTLMWDSPFTERHLAVLRGLGVLVVPPVTKRLACGDLGNGAMAAPLDICGAVLQSLGTAPRGDHTNG